MIIHVTGYTDRFNLSRVGADFINDACFGEDLSHWLVPALAAHGVEADVVCMEDFGWTNSASHAGASYLVCVSGNGAGDASRPDYGQWHVMIERDRTLMQKILGRNRLSATDPVVQKVAQILRDGGFASVAVEV
jgi:hypothetical protein